MNRRSFLQLSLASLPFNFLLAKTASKEHLPRFLDISSKCGVNFKHEASKTSQKYLPETMGAGVAMLDYNNDGHLDIFFVNGAQILDPMPAGKNPDKSSSRFWNRLYRNNGDGSFIDVTEAAGLQGRSYGMGAATGDYDNDGYTDLLVTTVDGSLLYHNNGDGTFSDVTEKAGVAGSGWCTGACFVDYDRDGLLDIVVTRYLGWSFADNLYCGDTRPGFRGYCHPDKFKAVSSLLYHNNGNGTFNEVSKAGGLAAFPGKGLGIAVNDFDRDGWPDIFVANDSFPQQLFRNNRNGTFSEIGQSTGMAYDQNGRVFAGMGIDIADYDNDGWPDIFINALANQKYALFHNHGSFYEYVSDPSGIGSSSLLHSGWGAKLFDYDNDGWLDLFVAQGHVMDNIERTDERVRYREPLLLMKNSNGQFRDVSKVSGDPFLVPLAARGAAVGDLNNDGLLDIVVSCNDGTALVLINQGGNDNHWLLIRLVGSASNRDGIGARVHMLTSDGREQFAYASTAGSYLSASDKRIHFGLGKATTVKLLEVFWPSGIQQRLTGIAGDQILTIREPAK